MKKIRCVIAGVSHIMLADIMNHIAEQNLNIELINNIEEGELLSHVQQLDINVVMTSFDTTELPKACNDLLEEVSDVAVVGLVDDGRKLCICINDAGPAELIELIQTAVQGKLKRLE